MKIIIYGAGKNGKFALELLEKYGLKSNIVGFADSKKQGEYLGFPIMPIDAVNKEIKDVILFPKETRGINNGMKK